LLFLKFLFKSLSQQFLEHNIFHVPLKYAIPYYHWTRSSSELSLML